MPISTIVPTKGGGAVGWNSDTNSWVPVDQNVMQGSTIGNLARGASLGFQQVGQGVNQLLFGPNDPNVQAAGKVLDLQSQAAENAAPYAIALGMGAPEVAGGALTAIATGGASIPEMIAYQAVTGGGIGGLRPGDPGQRVLNAVVGAAFAGGGEGMGLAAMQGIGAAMRVGKAVTSDSIEATAQGVVNGIARQQNAEARAALEAGAGAEGAPVSAGADAGVEGGAGAGAAGEAVGQPGSVGAARTPGGAIDPVTAAEYRAMDQMDRTAGENLTTAGTGKILQDAQELGWKPAWWAGSEKSSMARVLAATSEFDPRQAGGEFGRKEANQMLYNRAGAMATGMSDTLDPVANTQTRMDITAMQRLRGQLDQGQEALVGELPPIVNRKINDIVRDVDVEPGASPTVGKAWNDYKSGMLDLTGKAPDAYVSPKGFINTIRDMTKQSAEAAKYGDTNSMEAFQEAINKLYRLAENETKAAPSGRGISGQTRDPTITGRGWAELRREEQMYMMLNKPGVVDGQGNVNPQALYRAMKRNRANGGLGIYGPGAGTPQEPLWKLTLGAIDEDLKGSVPPTGARIVGALGGLARGTMRNTAAQVLGGGALANTAIGSIWGNK